MTQIELAGATGLSPATVSNIVKELTASGVLHTSFTSRSGRRATLVSLARQVGLVAGAHFSTRKLHVAIADATRSVVAETSIPLAPDHRHDAELDRLSLLLGDMVDGLGGSLSDLLGVGLALPAPVDPRTSVISTPGLLPGWDGVDIARSLSARIGRPVHVDSEANLGALAEAREGAARGASSSVYVTVGHSISAGLLVDGELFRGASGRTGQIGHMTIDENGALCRCGNRGCLETVAAGPALLAGFSEADGIHRLRDLVTAAGDGVPAAQRTIADAGRHIGIAAASLCNLIDPERIVVGGELARAGEILLAPLRHALDRAILGSGVPEIVASAFAEWAETRGAIALALDHVAVDADLVALPA